MATILKAPRIVSPGFTKYKQVPFGRLAIDWTNPFTKHLAFCLVANSPNPIDLVTGTRLTKGAGVSFKGGAYVFNQSATGIITIPDSPNNFDKAGTGTLFSAIVVANIDSTYTSSFPTFIARGDTSAGEWMFRDPGTNRLNIYADIGDVNAATAFGTIDYNKYGVYGFSIDGGGAEVYENGANVASDTLGNVDVSAVAKPITIGGADGDSARYFKGAIRLVLGFNKNLFPPQHAALGRDPFQVLKPANDPIYFIPAAAAGFSPYWAAGSNVIMNNGSP